MCVIVGSGKELHITRHGISITDVRHSNHDVKPSNKTDFYIDQHDSNGKEKLPQDFSRQISTKSEPGYLSVEKTADNGALASVEVHESVDVQPKDQNCCKKILSWPAFQMMR